MKTQDKQIFSLLQAYDSAMVLKAIKLYEQGIADQFKDAEQELRADGWYPVATKPTDVEFYVVGDSYWVQNEESKIAQREAEIAKMKEAKKKVTENAKGKKQNMELSATKIKCPVCFSKMYKQNVCTGCKEGKQGYKIRLICEDNINHEILL